MKVASGAGMSMRGGAGNKGDSVVSSEGDVDVAGGRARWRECCSSPRFSDSSWKTSLTISHSRSISVMSFCRLAWKENVVKVVEVFTGQVYGGVWRE